VRERVERLQRVEQRPGRRQDRVELAQDRGLLDVAADVRVRAERHRAKYPSDQKPHASREDGAQRTVDGGERGRPQTGAQARADTLESGGEHAAGHDRADQRERRCPLRFAAAG